MVRAVVLRVIGGKLRDILARGDNQRFVALLAGLGVTGLLQSSTATCLMALFFSFDLSRLSPLLIFAPHAGLGARDQSGQWGLGLPEPVKVQLRRAPGACG